MYYLYPLRLLIERSFQPTKMPKTEALFVCLVMGIVMVRLNELTSNA